MLTTLVALLAGCSSNDDSTKGTASTTTAPKGSTTTTAAPETDPLVTWSERGPHGVGNVQLDLGGRRTMVWYPAVEGAGTEGKLEMFDIASLLSPELQAQIPDAARVQYQIASGPDAEPDRKDGPYPVVLFSHGFAGFPEQSADLTTHLASWGYVVVATDHVERSLSGLLGTGAQGVAKQSDPEVLAAALDLVTTEDARDGSPLKGLVDLDRVAVTGHSAGAGATYRFASTDPRIDAAIMYSVGSGPEGGTLPAAPKVPAMVMLGTTDGIIPPEASRTLFAGLNKPRYLVEITDAGHLVFSDLCLIGAESGGLIGIAEKIKLPIPDSLKKLGTDGCEAPHPSVKEAFPAIDGLSVAFLRRYLNDDQTAEKALTSGPVTGLDGKAEVTLLSEP